MSVFLTITYKVADPETYAKYNPGSLPIIGGSIARNGGNIVAAGPPQVLEGEAHVCVILKFPDADSAHGFINDEEYKTVSHLRTDSTTDTRMLIVDAFVPPQG